MTEPSAMFTGPRYYDEALAPFTFAPFAAALVDLIPQEFSGSILEVACGTGVVTRALRKRLGLAVQLTATDLSPAMLAYARSQSQSDNAIRWMEADAMSLPFETGSFMAGSLRFRIHVRTGPNEGTCRGATRAGGEWSTLFQRLGRD